MPRPPEQNPQATPLPSPEATALLLSIFGDLYRQEVTAEEDVPRTLPFFATALGLVVAAIAYAAGRLPRWPDLSSRASEWIFVAAAALLGSAIVSSALVLLYIAQAVTRRSYRRIGPEPALQAYLRDMHSFYGETVEHDSKLGPLLFKELQAELLRSYVDTTPNNRRVNERRYRLRTRAAFWLVSSLTGALLATILIFAADKLGMLPKVVP